MCSPTTCRTCSKTTWAGCGQHVDRVMRNVPSSQQCTCSADQRETGGLLARLFGR